MVSLACVLAGCSARVAGGLDESRANEAVAALEERGIASEKRAEGTGAEVRFAVEVARGDLGEALRVLDSSSLPRHPDPGISETYAEPSLVPSPTEDRARYHAAVAGELARTLERIDGVVEARVHVASPPQDELALDAEPAPARAAVLVTTRRGRAIDASAVRALVVGAVDGLAPDSVNVVLVPARSLPSRGSRYARVGPFRVSPSSASLLGVTLAASFLTHIGLASALLVVLRRKSRESAADLVAAPVAA